MKKPNPVLEKARKEAYDSGLRVGFAKGLEAGEMQGVQKAIDFFIQKFDGLENVEGIGPRTMEKIRKQLGHEYFLTIEKDVSR